MGTQSRYRNIIDYGYRITALTVFRHGDLFRDLRAQTVDKGTENTRIIKKSNRNLEEENRSCHSEAKEEESFDN